MDYKDSCMATVLFSVLVKIKVNYFVFKRTIITMMASRHNKYQYEIGQRQWTFKFSWNAVVILIILKTLLSHEVHAEHSKYTLVRRTVFSSTHTATTVVIGGRQHTESAGLLKLNITMVRAGYFQTRMQGLSVFFFFLGDEGNSWGFINKDTFKTLLTARRQILYFWPPATSVTHKRPEDFTTDKLELLQPLA